MKKPLLHSLGIIVAAASLLGAPSISCAQPAFPLHTSGQFIVDSNGNRVRLNSVNWDGAETTDYVVAGLQVAPLQSIVQEIKSLGFNAVRLLWSNEGYESDPIVETTSGYDPNGVDLLAANPSMKGEDYLTIMDQVVNALTSAGLMVILDNHVSTASYCCSSTDGNAFWYNTQYPESNWIADWQGMAARYANNPWVIGADLRNEPRSRTNSDGTVTNITWGGEDCANPPANPTDWHCAAERGGDAVLTVNPNLLIFVEGIDYARDLTGVRNYPIQLNVANRLVYSAHAYVPSPYLTSYADYVSRMTQQWGYLLAGPNPQPIWIGEFNTCTKSDVCVTGVGWPGYTQDTVPADYDGYVFNSNTSYFNSHNLDWSYFTVNGTAPTGNPGSPWKWGDPWGGAVLNPTYNGSMLPSLTARLQWLMTAPNEGSGPADGTYRIINANSGLAMSVDSSSLSNGASILQWSYFGGAAQKWNLHYLGNGTYEITNVNSGLALSVYGQSLVNANLDQWSYWGGAAQQFIVIPYGDGTYYLINANSGLTAEVPQRSGSNGTVLMQDIYVGGTTANNERWKFETP